MPCNTDHMRPQAKELEHKQLAQFYAGTLLRLGKSVPQDLADQASHIYGVGPYSFANLTETLCSTLKEMRDSERNQVIFSVHDFNRVPLAQWWASHQEADAKLNKKGGS